MLGHYRIPELITPPFEILNHLSKPISPVWSKDILYNRFDMFLRSTSSVILLILYAMAGMSELLAIPSATTLVPSEARREPIPLPTYTMTPMVQSGETTSDNLQPRQEQTLDIHSCGWRLGDTPKPITCADAESTSSGCYRDSNLGVFFCARYSGYNIVTTTDYWPATTCSNAISPGGYEGGAIVTNNTLYWYAFDRQ